MSAWACENSLVLGQLKVNEKSNEITAIPELLNVLDIKGNIITIDAMGTQKEIAKTIIDNEGNYILSLKENHSVLYRDVKDYFESEVLTKSKQQLQEKGLYYIERDQDHGRYEKREYYVCNDIEWLWEKDDRSQVLHLQFR